MNFVSDIFQLITKNKFAESDLSLEVLDFKLIWYYV